MPIVETQSFSPDADTWSLLLLVCIPVASAGPKLLVTYVLPFFTGRQSHANFLTIVGVASTAKK